MSEANEQSWPAPRLSIKKSRERLEIQPADESVAKRIRTEIYRQCKLLLNDSSIAHIIDILRNYPRQTFVLGNRYAEAMDFLREIGSQLQKEKAEKDAAKKPARD